MNVLVLNSGSSTLKFQVIATDIEQIAQDKDDRICRGDVEVKLRGTTLVDSTGIDWLRPIEDIEKLFFAITRRA